MAKKTNQVRKLGVLFAFPVSIAVWVWRSIEIFQNLLFRITHLIGLISIIFVVWAMVRSYKKNDDGRLVWFIAMQSWSWAIFDYLVSALLGHSTSEWIPVLKNGAIAVQLGALLLGLTVTALVFPVAQRIHARSKRKSRKPTNESKVLATSLAGILAVSALRHLLLAIEDPIVDAFVYSCILLLLLFTFEFFSCFVLLYHLDINATAEEEEPAGEDHIALL